MSRALTAEAVSTPASRLNTLVRCAMLARGWTDAQAAQEAKSRGLKNYSASTFAAMRRDERKRPPTPEKVRRLAELFGYLPEDWSQEVGLDTGSAQLLRDEEYIVQEQDRIEAGTVTIISCRGFLETSRVAIFDMVLRNLQQGVTYRYCFPELNAGPFGDEAYRSYREIRHRLLSHSFNLPPRLFGFSVDPNAFTYFSRLHTIVHQAGTTPGGTQSTQAYGFIEVALPDSQTKRVWYPLPPRVWSQIESDMRQAVTPMADTDPPCYLHVNPLLSHVRDEYLNWFTAATNVDLYSHISEALAHRGERCAKAIQARINADLQIEAGPQGSSANIDYLDIGCGDGRVTQQVAHALAGRTRRVSTVGLDSSPVQLQRAKQLFSASAPFTGVCSSIEQYESEEAKYHVITAVHSLYVVDLAFLKRIFRLLHPGGVACIWMGTLQGNAVNCLSNAFDGARRGGQRRNYAEDIEAYLRLAGLERHNRLTVERHHSPLTSTLVAGGRPTSLGEDVATFCALTERGALAKSDLDLTVDVLAASTAAIDDRLIAFRR